MYRRVEEISASAHTVYVPNGSEGLASRPEESVE